MFGRKKQLKEIETKLKRIEKEKEELIKIKEMLDDVSPKIDISDVYVWQVDNFYYIVKQYNKLIKSPYFRVESTLVDIFTNDVIYKKRSDELINKKEIINEESNKFKYGYLYPLHEIYKNILAYTDKKVPLYVLQQLYYTLNNVDITKIKTKIK